MGINLITDINEKENLAQLELLTGKRSKQTIAYEAAYLNGDFTAVDYYTDTVISHSTMILDKVRAYEVKIASYSAQTRLKEAMATGLAAFEMLGIDFPKKPSRMDVLFALVKTKIKIVGKQPENLINMARMSDPYALATDRLINSIIFPAYFWDPNFFVLVVLRNWKL